MATAISQGAADQGLNVSSKNQPLINSPDSVSLGGSKNSKFLSANSLDLAGATVADNRNTGVRVGRSATVGNITVNNNADSGDLYNAILSGQEQTKGLFESILGKFTESVDKIGGADTSGTSALTNLPTPAATFDWKWIAAGAAVIGAVWWLFGKKG